MKSKIINFSIICFLSIVSQKGYTMSNTAHDFSFKDIDGNTLPLSNFKGKVLLVVNVASECGLTKQYKALQEVYKKFQPNGFEVIAVPSNDFGSQEPASCPIIKDFAQTNYQVTFTMTDKYHVIGDGAHPFYKWANQKAGFLGGPKWNFHKYLINKDGNFVDWFSSVTAPDDNKIETRINELLK